MVSPNHGEHPVQGASTKQQTKQKHKPNHQQTGLPPHSALTIRGKPNKQKLSTNLNAYKACTNHWTKIQFIQFICSVVSDSLWPHGLQHARPPCPSPSPKVYSSSCPLSRWCHPTISSSVVPFSSCLQSFPASKSFLMSLQFASGGQILELQLQCQSFQWIFRIDSFRVD